MPSIPQSLLWIALVVLWLFVLVPMLVNRKDPVRRTSDVALAARVLTRGPATKLKKKTGPASGHASDPHWRPRPDDDDGEEYLIEELASVGAGTVIHHSVTAVVVETDSNSWSSGGATRDRQTHGRDRQTHEDYLDVDIVDPDESTEDSSQMTLQEPAHSVCSSPEHDDHIDEQNEPIPVQEEPSVASEEPTRVQAVRTDLDYSIDHLDREDLLHTDDDHSHSDQDQPLSYDDQDIRAEHQVSHTLDEDPIDSTEDEDPIDSTEVSVNSCSVSTEQSNDDVSDHGDEDNSVFSSEHDDLAIEQNHDREDTSRDNRYPRSVRPRNANSVNAAAAAQARKYNFRKRTVLILAGVMILTGISGITVAPSLKWVAGITTLLLIGYLTYLRRQTRIEQRIRDRRALRAHRGVAEVTRLNPLHKPEASSESYSLRDRHVRVVALDDEDPIFTNLDYADLTHLDHHSDLPPAVGQ